MTAGLIPNILSISRILMAPFIFISIKTQNDKLLLILLIAAFATDYFDGLLARRLSGVTEAGKILDPLADKICVFLGSLAATIYLEMPLFLFIAIIGRDLAIAIVGLMIIHKRRVIPVSNWTGKVAAFVISSSLVIFIFRINSFYLLATIATCLAVAASGLSYLAIGLRLLKSEK